MQLRTELVCDIGFCRNDPETLITIGKEHIRWWKIYPDTHTIQSSAKPEYEVGYAKYTWASYETLITIGKEHIRWWKIYPDTHTIQSSAKPEYEVGNNKKSISQYIIYPLPSSVVG